MHAGSGQLQDPSVQVEVPLSSRRYIGTSSVQPTPLVSDEQDVSPAPMSATDDGMLLCPPEPAKPSKAGCGDRFVRCCCRQLAWRPLLCLCLQQFAIVALVAVLWKPLEVDTDFESFVRADGPTSRHRDGFIHAFQFSEHTYAAKPPERRLFPRTHSTGIRELHIMYQDASGGNLLTERKLLAMQRFEQYLRELPGWRKLCKDGVSFLGDAHGAEYQELWGSSCDPGDSFMNYAWAAVPSSSTSSSRKITLNGKGFQLLPIDAVIHAIKNQPEMKGGSNADPMHRFFPKSFNVPGASDNLESSLLRSHFFFHPIVGEGTMYASSLEVNEAWRDFVVSELHPALIENKDMKEAGIEVFFKGSFITEHDIFNTLWGDCYLAAGGMTVVLACLFLHSRSSLVSVIGLLLIFESIPVSYVLFVTLSGLDKISIVNCVALFVIIGVGSDIVFVFTDTWKQSNTIVPEIGSADPKTRLYERLIWTYKSAGKSCAATTLSTACSFLANLASALQPLREFGLFMGLCVIWTYLLVAAISPVLLLKSETSEACGCCSKSARSIVASENMESSDSPVRMDDVQLPITRDYCCTVLSLDSARLFRDMIGEFIQRCRKRLVFFFCCISVIFLVASILMIKVDDGMPEIFPEGHNQHGVKDVDKQFTIALSSYPAFVYDLDMCDFTQVENKKDPEAEICEDKDVQCPAWTSMGECYDNEAFMARLCMRSCHQVDKPIFQSKGVHCKECLFDWCSVPEVPKKPVVGSQGNSCECFSKTKDPLSIQSADSVYGGNVTLRIAGLTQTDFELAWQAFENHVLQSVMPLNSVNQSVVRKPGLVNRPTFVQEHWRSGKTAMQTAFDVDYIVSAALVQDNNANPQFDSRGATEVQHCFCGGMSVCNDVGSSVGIVNITRPSERRQLQAPDMDRARPAEQRLLQAPDMDRLTRVGNVVTVVWGIEITEAGPFDLFANANSTEAWSFDWKFDPGDPKAQRSMRDLVTNIPAELRVLPGATWINDFEWWLERRGGFPSRRFHDAVPVFLERFLNNTDKFLWDSSGKVVAVKVDLYVGLSERAPLGETMALKEKWDAYIEKMNNRASARAGEAFHTSKLWVRAEAQSNIIGGTLMSILISVLCGFGAIVLFTKSFCLALFVSAVVMAIMLAQAFFMVVVMGWRLGAVEVVALIVFVGYVFTYNLHIAHMYQCCSGLEENATKQELRAERVRFALYRMGRSTVGSAATTLGCSLFLFFCTLRFFVKFGAVIFSVTSLSVIYALILLPALLMLCGPVKPPCLPRILQSCLQSCLLSILPGAVALQAEEPEPGLSAITPEGYKTETLKLKAAKDSTK